MEICNLGSHGHSCLIDAQWSCWEPRHLTQIRIWILRNAAVLRWNVSILQLVQSLSLPWSTLLCRFWSVSMLRLHWASRCIRSPPNCWNSPNCMALRLRIRSLAIGACWYGGIPNYKCLPHQRITEGPPQWREVMINVRQVVLLSEDLLNAPSWWDLSHARLMTECWIYDHHGNVRKTSSVLWYLPL